MPFSADERRLLLATPGIGPLVVLRLEQAGFESLAAIGEAGVAQVVNRVTDHVGTRAWGNRRAALERALGLQASRQAVSAGPCASR